MPRRLAHPLREEKPVRVTGQFLGESGPSYPEGWPLLEVGWVVVPNRQGQGIATEAGRASLDSCFANLDVERVCGLIRPDNVPSRRVATKLGARVDHRFDGFIGGPVDVWIHTPSLATRRRI